MNLRGFPVIKTGTGVRRLQTRESAVTGRALLTTDCSLDTRRLDWIGQRRVGAAEGGGGEGDNIYLLDRRQLSAGCDFYAAVLFCSVVPAESTRFHCYLSQMGIWDWNLCSLPLLCQGFGWSLKVWGESSCVAVFSKQAEANVPWMISGFFLGFIFSEISSGSWHLTLVLILSEKGKKIYRNNRLCFYFFFFLFFFLIVRRSSMEDCYSVEQFSSPSSSNEAVFKQKSPKSFSR